MTPESSLQGHDNQRSRVSWRRIAIALALCTVPCVPMDAAMTEDQAMAIASRFIPDTSVTWQADSARADRFCLSSTDGRKMRIQRQRAFVSSYFRPGPRVGASAAEPNVSREEAQTIALGYIARSGAAVPVEQLHVEHSRGSTWHLFYFTRILDDIALPEVFAVSIDCSTGELVEYVADVRPLTLDLNEPRVAREQAYQLAMQAGSRAGFHGATPVSAMLSVLPVHWRGEPTNASQFGDEQALVWRVRVDALREETMPVGVHDAVAVDVRHSLLIDIDATNGAIRFITGVDQEDLRPLEPLPAEPNTYTLFDQSPAWADSHTIYFVTTRQTAAHGVNYQRPDRCTSVFRIDCATKQMSSILPDAFTYAPVNPVADPTGRYIAFTNVRDAGILDLHTGATGRFGYHREGGQQPAWHPDGQSLAVTANREGSQDIFRIKLGLEQLRSRDTSVLTRVDADQFSPKYAPDGSWLAFTAREYIGPGSAIDTVCLVRMDETEQPAAEPQLIVTGLPALSSLSVFPDAQRLLVCHERGLEVIDLDSRTKFPLKWPSLRDPDLPGDYGVVVREAALSPDGARIAFSGLRWSGNVQDPAGWYIYVCDLDGSNLQRLTPLEDDPVPPYVFPETGKTAFDVAREIALQRTNADG